MPHFIEIQEYGDFDVLYTKCIMFSERKTDMLSLNKEFVAKYGISPNPKTTWKIGDHEITNDGELRIRKDGVSNIDLDKNRDVGDLYVEFLKDKGFTTLRTKLVRFSD